MNSKLAALFLASATLGAGPAIFAPPTSAHAQVEVSFDFFYDTLSPHGEWIEVGDYGMCWRPNDVGPDWAPYTDGYWTYTDAGWTWVSYEDFGAVAYHYGRWVSVEDEGWCWVPDYEWGPAWVSWRNNDNYIGWAPLPPEARWEPDRGFSVWVDTSYDIGPSYYNFCAVEDFGAPVIREVIIERPRNFFIIGDTFNITNISINRSIGVPFCGGPRFDFIRGRSRRPIPTLKLVRETNITNIEKNVYINKTVNKTVINNNGGGRRGGLRAAVQGNQLIVPAPKVKRAEKNQIVEKVKPSRRVAANRVNRGWKGVRDENQRREIRDRIAKQTEGRRPENAPAKPVEVAELKPVPAKADPNAPSPVTGRNRNRDREDRPGRNADRPDRNADQPAEKPQRAERPEDSDRPSRPSRPESPSRPPAEAPARAEEKKRDTPGTAGGRRDLKPFNEKREDRREERKKDDTPEVVPPPAPMVPKPQDAGRDNDRKRPDRGEREAQENRRQKQEQEDTDALQRSRQQRQREEQQLQDRMRQRQADPAGEAQRDAARRQREADQQEMKQQQRRQQQARESEAMQRQQQQRSEENRQRQQQQRAEESRQQQMQALQRQQAAREQQQQEFRRQQRQAQPERQMQREMPRPQRQAPPERQVQRERPQPQRQQFQPRPQQEQRMQPRQGGGGGGRGEGGARGDGGGRNRGNGQEEGRGRR